jgi:hypothetical protein
MNREQILAEIKRVAEANGNLAIGERSFFARTRINRTVLRRAGFPNYGAAVEAAGYRRNSLKQAYGDDELFTPIARLARELGHWPTYGERAVARYKDSAFPGEASISRRTKVEPLAQGLLNWCRKQTEFRDVAEFLEATASLGSKSTAEASNRKVVTGYVYLMRYGARGKDFKLGHSENVQRRQAQIDMVSPHDVRVVHSIETDDPEGIEKYWQERFSGRRIKTKEVFRLTPDDIAAFKRRRYQ